MRIVAALGGNALLRRGEQPESSIQQAHIDTAADALAPLARDHELIITHGNGPQVGLLAVESTDDPNLAHPYPLDALGAQTQGLIGYWLVQALTRRLPGQQIGALICRTLVDGNDPAFRAPTKFVGPVYDQATANDLAKRHGWHMHPDGPAWRRVVASPEPIAVVELDLVERLTRAGVTVICAGGGGIPVERDTDGTLHGIEAVVDKDLTAALVAIRLNADMLLIMTDVDSVVDHYGTSQASPIDRATPAQLRGRSFPAGSMGPKVEAACRFVEATGRPAAIGNLDAASALVAGTAGTLITAVVPGDRQHAAGRIPATRS
jgi:carbamate kinase